MSDEVKVYLHQDERYPDIGFDDSERQDLREKFSTAVVIDAATEARWRQGIAAYEALQDEMIAAIQAAEEQASGGRAPV